MLNRPFAKLQSLTAAQRAELEFDLLMLVAPVLRKLAYAEGKVGTLTA